MKEPVITPYYNREKNQFFNAYGRQRKVNPLARDIYSYFYDHVNILKSKEDIMDFAFGKGNHNVNKLYVYISRLNKIIAQHEKTKIYNKRGFGYILAIPPSQLA